MGQVYLTNIIYNPPARPIYNVPNIIQFSTSSIIYDSATDNYVEGPVLPLYMQYESNIHKLQYALVDCLLDAVRLQTINFQTISLYTGQYAASDIAANSRYLQGLSRRNNSKTSNQYIIDYAREGNLQRIAFSNKERDKLIWMHRAVESTTNKYYNWSSESLNLYPSGQFVNGSKDTLGVRFVKGTKIINLIGKLYVKNDVPGGEDAKEYKDTPYLIISDQDGDGLIDVDQSGQEVFIEDPNPQNLQIYLQKINNIPANSIKQLWINRGMGINPKHYIYWKDTVISSLDTIYNVTQDSKESINIIYKK